MFRINLEVIKRLFAEPTPEEEQKKEWEDINEILNLPSIYPNFDAEKACQIVKEDYPDRWYNHSEEFIKIAREAEESY